MEETWDNDIQSKKCYIYDYFHDDKPWMNENMSYENTTKTPIDAKFIITSSQSIDKDQITVMLQFKPSQKLNFTIEDELYYYETDYKGKYNANFPCGMYCDIPDEKGIYHKWLICAKQVGNQFIKYLILPCTYRFHWIENKGNSRVERKMWGVVRSQNSYNSGLWTDYITTSVENQFKAMLPMNQITEKIFYVDEFNNNQRFIISAMTENPRAWKTSKVEDMLMGEFGLLRLTFTQESFNPSTDYIDYNALNPDGSKDFYAMYADYYSSSIEPTENEFPEISSDTCVLSASTNIIKVGGSYKTITAKFYNNIGEEITDIYLPNLSINNWHFYIDDIEVVNEGVITILEQTEKNKIKVKFCNDSKYISKILVLKCIVDDVIGELMLEITNL